MPYKFFETSKMCTKNRRLVVQKHFKVCFTCAFSQALVKTRTGPDWTGRIFFWTRFENLVAKRQKINNRVVPILVAYIIGMTS